VTDEDAGTVWESQAEVDAVLSETGATMDKVRRWRREGLLSREIDWRPGSFVRYPRGTLRSNPRDHGPYSRKRTAPSMSGYNSGGEAFRLMKNTGGPDCGRWVAYSIGCSRLSHG
jgi:hypothetical protein